MKKVHFVGIGGIGMSGLAAMMLARGARVSGSDLHENLETLRLRGAGAAVHIGHDARQVDGTVDEVVISSAIDEANVEVRSAREQRIPIVRRLHALAPLLEGHESVGVAGTHGKTTTTAMVASILVAARKDPSFLIGGDCPALGGNARLGRGVPFVTEVDESDGLFLDLSFSIAVLTNIGRDHLNTYGDLDAIVGSFRRYLKQSERAVLCIDDPHVRELAASAHGALTVGISQDADLTAVGIEHHRLRTRFDLLHRGRRVAPIVLPTPGDHNVRNALCAIGASFLSGVDLEEAAGCLAEFQLPHRRFELLEENGVTVVDDYAHLPEQIEVTLKAIRDGWEDRRIVAIFQPHRYTRTQAIGAEFGSAFREADTVLVTSIYPACERPIPGVSAQEIVDSISASTGVRTHFIQEKEDVISFLKDHILPGDFIISFGAGDICTVTEELSCFLREGRFCLA